MIVLLIPAAGSATRMRGRDKLLEDVDGAPCLRVMAERGLAAGLSVVATVPHLDHLRAKALVGSDVRCVAVPDADQGMAHSLRAGIAALPADAEAVMILPGDMPAIEASDMRRVVDAFTDAAAPAAQATTEDGSRGHPTVFDRSLFDKFKDLAGDRGAYGVLEALGEQVVLVPLPGGRARQDLDTPEDWVAWRANTVQQKQ